MRTKRILTALLLALMWVFAAQAGTTTFQGVSVDYGSAGTSTSGKDLILTYNASSSLKLGGPVKVRALLVGGGGSGSSGGLNSNKSGYGGQGGIVLDEADVLLSGDCDITVGAGGAGGVAPRSLTKKNGANGGDSKVEGFDTTAVYGTFSVKFNASKSRALAKGQFIHNVIPVGYEKLNSVSGAQNAAYESRGAE